MALKLNVSSEKFEWRVLIGIDLIWLINDNQMSCEIFIAIKHLMFASRIFQTAK